MTGKFKIRHLHLARASGCLHSVWKAKAACVCRDRMVREEEEGAAGVGGAKLFLTTSSCWN